MSLQHSPSIVTNGLIFYVDAANPRSAPGTSYWYDISGYSSTMTMNGSPSLTTMLGAACYNFTATGQSFTGTLNATQPTTDMTMDAWICPQTDVVSGDMATILLMNGGQSAYLSLDKTTRQQADYWYSHPTTGYWETGAAISNNTWTNFVSVWQYSTSNIYQYANNVQTIGNPTIGSLGTGTSLVIGQESTARQFSGGIAIVRVYGRALSSTEVTQNFNAMRGRFGV